jgi:hypothetical protein
VARYAFTVWNFHPQHLAGFGRRTNLSHRISHQSVACTMIGRCMADGQKDEAHAEAQWRKEDRPKLCALAPLREIPVFFAASSLRVTPLWIRGDAGHETL